MNYFSFENLSKEDMQIPKKDWWHIISWNENDHKLMIFLFFMNALKFQMVYSQYGLIYEYKETSKMNCIT